MESVQNRVQRGIEILDEHGPAGWRDRVYVNQLCIDSLDACVLGWVYGDFGLGVDALDSTLPYNWVADGGFGTLGSRDAVELTAEWRRRLS